jgi:hypothetical protein
MEKIYGIIFFMLVMVSCISPPQIYENRIEITIDEYSEHLMHYFENKNDAIIYETISIYKNNDNIGMLDRMDSMIIFFFYGIKTDNVVRYNSFSKVITESKIERLINIFQVIDKRDIVNHLEHQEASSELNDVYWTLYFSTGNVKYLDNLLNVVMDYCNETKNVNYYLAARTAMWSISSNMQTFPQVREYIQKNNILDNGITEYIINTDPNKIRAETIDFVKMQRKKGIWLPRKT